MVMGWMFREVCRWELGVSLGWLPMIRRHLHRENLKSVVVGGTCGSPDRGDISKNGLNSLLI